MNRVVGGLVLKTLTSSQVVFFFVLALRVCGFIVLFFNHCLGVVSCRCLSPRCFSFGLLQVSFLSCRRTVVSVSSLQCADTMDLLSGPRLQGGACVTEGWSAKA